MLTDIAVNMVTEQMFCVWILIQAFFIKDMESRAATWLIGKYTNPLKANPTRGQRRERNFTSGSVLGPGFCLAEPQQSVC